MYASFLSALNRCRTDEARDDVPGLGITGRATAGWLERALCQGAEPAHLGDLLPTNVAKVAHECRPLPALA